MLPALVCAAVYALLRPASVSIAFAAGMAALYAALLSALRAFFLELQYTVRVPATFACTHHRPSLMPLRSRDDPLFCKLCRVANGVYIPMWVLLLSRFDALRLHAVQARQVSEAELADEDSRFKVLDEVAVHYKVANGAAGSAPELGVAMYHGFGANTFSWSFVDRLLADSLQALVTSHDMPGFGLTQR